MQSVSNERDQLSTQIESLKERVNELACVKEALDNELNQLRLQVANVEKKESTISQRSAPVSVCRDLLEPVDDKCSKDQMIANLESDLQTANNKLSDLEIQLNSLNNQNDSRLEELLNKLNEARILN